MAMNYSGRQSQSVPLDDHTRGIGADGREAAPSWAASAEASSSSICSIENRQDLWGFIFQAVARARRVHGVRRHQASSAACTPRPRRSLRV